MIRKTVVLLATVLVSQAIDADAQSLSDLEFMTGCWRGEYAPGRFIEEYYSSASDNLIVGTTRYLREGRTTMFEFATITADTAGIVLLPYPRGNPSEHGFRLTHLEGHRAVFEAPQHDYPRRIIYSTTDDGVRIARIDGGPDDTGGQEWRMRRVDC